MFFFLVSSSCFSRGMTGETRVRTFAFPKEIYLESLGAVNQLNFDLGFVAESTGEIMLVMFRYFDADGRLLLQRRLVKHHIDNVARFMSVFDRENKVRCYDNHFLTGECVFVTHPYPEISADYDIHAVKCTAYASLSGKVSEVEWEVRVKRVDYDLDIQPPFKGRWIHFEGHDVYTHHRQIFSGMNSNFFGIDFMKVDEKGAFYSGSGAENKDFFCFGEPVYAPAAGVIESVVDRFDDNTAIGEVAVADPGYPGGNTVIIRHTDQLYSYLAHFKKGSIKVKALQKVKQGEFLGLSGNSGASSAPHIHFHLMSSPERNVLKTHGIPPVFRRFYRIIGNQKRLAENCGTYPGEILESCIPGGVEKD